jgi:hypothetical protein
MCRLAYPGHASERHTSQLFAVWTSTLSAPQDSSTTFDGADVEVQWHTYHSGDQAVAMAKFQVRGNETERQSLRDYWATSILGWFD